MIVTLKRCCAVTRNYVTRAIGLTPLPMSMSSPTARATPRDALRGVALSFVAMRPATVPVGLSSCPDAAAKPRPLGGQSPDPLL